MSSTFELEIYSRSSVCSLDMQPKKKEKRNNTIESALAPRSLSLRCNV